MSFLDYKWKCLTPEEKAAELSDAALVHELGKQHNELIEDIVLIKETLKRILSCIKKENN